MTRACCPSLHRRELRLGDVGAHVHGVEIRDLVERLARLHDLARLRVGDEHRAGARVRDLRSCGCDRRPARPARRRTTTCVSAVCCCACAAAICRGLRGDLPRLRLDLLVLRLELVLQHANLALGLIELLRGGRLLREQPLRALVRAPGDLELRLQGAALGDGGVALRLRRGALRLEHRNLLGHFADARRGGGALRRRLVALERELRRSRPSPTTAPAASVCPSSTVKVVSWPPASRRHDHLGRFDVAVGVGRLRRG